MDRVARWGLLDNVDLTRTMNGRERLSWSIVLIRERADTDTVQTLLSDTFCEEHSPSCCTKADQVSEKWKQDGVVPLREETAGCPDPLRVLEDIREKRLATEQGRLLPLATTSPFSA